MLKILEIKGKLFLRDYPAVFFTLAFCPIILFIFGLTMGNDPNPLLNDMGSIDISMPSYMVLIIAGIAFISFPISHVTAKERGEFKRQKLLAVSYNRLLFLDSLIYYLFALVGMVITTVVGYINYDIPLPENYGILFVAVTLCFYSVFFMGFLLSVIAKTTKSAQALGFAVFFTMLFLSGASTPLELMNEDMLALSDYIPLKYAVVFMKAAWFGDPFKDIQKEILILFAIGLACLVAGLAITHLGEYGITIKRKKKLNKSK